MSKDNDKIRAFIAVSLPDHVKDDLIKIQKSLKKKGMAASWPSPSTLHLTIKFLADISADQLDIVKSSMTETVSRFSKPVELRAAGVGVFPSVKNTRVIWTGISCATDELQLLAAYLNDSLHEKAGIKKERKRFSPHLTVARVKKKPHPKMMVSLMQEFESYESDIFYIFELSLFKSRLTSSGAIHTNLFSVTLDGK